MRELWWVEEMPDVRWDWEDSSGRPETTPAHVQRVRRERRVSELPRLGRAAGTVGASSPKKHRRTHRLRRGSAQACSAPPEDRVLPRAPTACGRKGLSMGSRGLSREPMGFRNGTSESPSRPPRTTSQPRLRTQFFVFGSHEAANGLGRMSLDPIRSGRARRRSSSAPHRGRGGESDGW